MRIILLLYLLIHLVSAKEYIIKFKSNYSLKSFLNSGIFNLPNVKVSDFLKGHSFGVKDGQVGVDGVKKIIQFNKFKCIIVDDSLGDSVSLDLIERLRKNPFVHYITPNTKVELYGKEHDEGSGEDKDGRDYYDYEEEEEIDEYTGVNIQHGAPRHLGKISTRTQLPFNVKDEKEYKDFIHYYYDKNYQGTNSIVYIIDTGVFKEHKEFNNRVKFGGDFIGEGRGDYNGHGTHVAGLIGSKTYGVAKNVTMVDVKVLDQKGFGNLTTVLSGIEFAVHNCRLQRQHNNDKKCIINMSLGTIRNPIINEAIKEAYLQGITVVVAAGNNNFSACWTSPASSNFAITVGAMDDRTDNIAVFSNWGQCVDIFAPGVRVKSLSNLYLDNGAVHSGTSMASPIVAGYVAILLDKGYYHDDIKQKLIEDSTKNVFSKLTLFFKYGTPNRVLYNGIEEIIESNKDKIKQKEELDDDQTDEYYEQDSDNVNQKYDENEENLESNNNQKEEETYDEENNEYKDEFKDDDANEDDHDDDNEDEGKYGEGNDVDNDEVKNSKLKSYKKKISTHKNRFKNKLRKVNGHMYPKVNIDKLSNYMRDYNPIKNVFADVDNIYLDDLWFV